MTEQAHVGIVGAGIAGLTAAFDLSKKGYRVTVLESSHRVGGLAAGFKASNWDWPLEEFYHHIFTGDEAILNLAGEIGSSVFFRRPVTSMWFEGKAYPFDSPMRVLSFPHLGFVDKMRMGLTIAYLRYLTRDWKQLETTTSDRWLRKQMGNQAYETLWQPMLQGKFGDHYDEVNLAWFWARMVKRSPSLGYFEGGFQTFADRLADALLDRGGQIRTDTRVSHIVRSNGGWQLQSADGDDDSEPFDAVVATVPPYLLARIVPGLPADYLAGLQQLQSMGAVVMTMAVDRPITDGHYWINLPKAAGFPFLAFVEHTNYIDSEHYGGDHVIYCGDYLDVDHAHFSMSDEELLDAFLPGIKRLRPDFERSWIRQFWVHKAAYAQPVPPVNYSHQIPDLRTPLTGLYFASMSQVYPWDRGTNYAVDIGHRVAGLVQDDLRNQNQER
ncbi:MAG: NAD(P)/FAD-dependent oxidoreductase [Chloroflexota bacterium]|nr:NAD(P)/FAD-dependent oxidoreductase [Chloroflexota bacterium]